jgi:hypothetical protein
MNEQKEIKTADDAVLNLFENPLFDVEFSLDKAKGVLNILRQNYFETTEEALEKDILIKYTYEKGYTAIQTLLCVVEDYILKASQNVESARGEYYKIFDAQRQSQRVNTSA